MRQSKIKPVDMMALRQEEERKLMQAEDELSRGAGYAWMLQMQRDRDAVSGDRDRNDSDRHCVLM
jgi:hypothetical protein